ncbi:MAG: 30S ribosomal protein S12 methylthiotransferase RimO [Anaerolineales bacterium]|nr:30S ribosomal protein S12 methylthiotransferase RimO [Anaerolineales bacterium]
MNRKTFHLTSLGCAKNSVDSDSMAQLLERDGYRLVKAPQQASVLIVNTCGFIGPARQESFAELRALAEVKRPDQILIAAGCLTQRYGLEVTRQVPGIDGVLGTRRWMDIIEVVRQLRKGPHPSAGSGLHPEPLYHLPTAATVGADEGDTLRASLAGASAYLKIADGCRRPCAFCAIPLIKGTAVSRPMNNILDDARRLRAMGVRELILIAQDTTDYGHDLGLKDGLATLLTRLVDEVAQTSPRRGGSEAGLDWIRILYAYPGYVTDRLIEVMATHPQILPYLDMPLQHAHPDTLKRMRRPANMDWVYQTLARMRAAMPNLAIRTTFIVGYPGETEAEFQTLLDFVSEARFDRVGGFPFSFEHGTASEPLGDPIPAEVKDERYQRLMTLQQNISLQINQSFVGQTLDMLVEGFDEGLYIGRSYRDAPEIDGLVLADRVGAVLPEGHRDGVSSSKGAAQERAEIGQILPVRITGAMTYDLEGVFSQGVTAGAK